MGPVSKISVKITFPRLNFLFRTDTHSNDSKQDSELFETHSLFLELKWFIEVRLITIWKFGKVSSNCKL